MKHYALLLDSGHGEAKLLSHEANTQQEADDYFESHEAMNCDVCYMIVFPEALDKLRQQIEKEITI